jgi:uncharacterized protein
MNNYYVYSQERVRSLLSAVFGWMTYALVLTGITSLYIFNNPKIMMWIHTNSGAIIGLVFAQLALVIALSAGVNRLSFGVALILFTLYSVLTGAMLSSIFVVFTVESIAAAFFVAAGMFAAMATYGAMTKADLTSWGSYLLMALIGLIIASLVNLFLQNSAFQFLISIVGVIVFAVLTAWDVQRFKQLAQYELPEAASLAFALSLYLDFINLFLYLVQLMGKRKE